MKIYFNNKEICVGARVTVLELLAGQNLHTGNVAVAVNNKVVPRSEWPTASLQEGAKITVIRAVCGG